MKYYLHYKIVLFFKNVIYHILEIIIIIKISLNYSNYTSLKYDKYIGNDENPTTMNYNMKILFNVAFLKLT